jgi:hypothetical protein
MTDDSEQIRRVAEAARAYREHQLTLRTAQGLSDFERIDWQEREFALRDELDDELRVWKAE